MSKNNLIKLIAIAVAAVAIILTVVLVKPAILGIWFCVWTITTVLLTLWVTRDSMDGDKQG